LLAVEELLHRGIDATAARLGVLRGVDVVDVEPTDAARQRVEERTRRRLRAGFLADGRADADHVRAAHHRDGVPVDVSVHLHHHRRPRTRVELGDVLGRDFDPGVVADAGERW
jgi:hypothetical protein